MAVTLFHKVIYNKVTIINRNENKKDTKIEPHKVSGKIKLNKHRIARVKSYD